MLIDSANSSLADNENGSIRSTPTGTNMNITNNENELNRDEDEDTDGYSLVSHTSSSGGHKNMNAESFSPNFETMMISKDLFDKSIHLVMDETNDSVTSTTFIEQEPIVETNLQNDNDDDEEEDDSMTEYAVVDHETLNTSDDVKKTSNVESMVTSKVIAPKKNDKSVWEYLGFMVLVVMLGIVVGPGPIRLIHTNVKLQKEIDQYKHELQMQYIHVDQLKNIIRQLEDEAVMTYEQHKLEFNTWEQRIKDMQVIIEARPDPKESVQKLEEQVHQLLEEVAAMEVTSQQEIRRYKRGYREIQKEHHQCNEIVSHQAQRMEELSNTIEHCTIRKRQLKKEMNKINGQLQGVKSKLRTETKELKGTSKEVQRQKKVILKLQKQLADIEMKKTEARKENKKKRKKDTKFHTSDEYTSTFTWDNGTTSNTAKKSINIDNCWMYLQAQMDMGECFYDMTDHVKDHFHTMGQTMSHTFQNAMKHLRSEMEEYHHSQHQQHQQYKQDN